MMDIERPVGWGRPSSASTPNDPPARAARCGGCSHGVTVALWIAVGTGLLADSYLPLARAGWCVLSPLGFLWPLAATAGLATIVALAVCRVREWNVAIGLLGAVVAACGMALLVLDLVPPIARDELTYHLAFPLLYLRAGRVHEIPFAIQSYYPALVEMLYLPLLGHVAPQATKYLHLAYGAATGGLILLYLRPRVAAWVAVFAAVFLFTTPTVSALGGSAYVDLGLLFYATTGLVGILRWSESGRWADFVAGALGAGCAASVKYNGVLVVAFLVLGVILLCQDRGVRAALGSGVMFGALSLIPLVPWLVKNTMETGNPVYPMAHSIFGGPPLTEVSPIGVLEYRQGLYGEGWLEMALTPLRVFVTGREFDPARFDGVFNPLYLIGVAATLRPGGVRRLRGLAGFSLLFLYMVFFLTVFRSRYVIAVLAPLVIVLAEIIERWRRDDRVPPRVIAAVAGAALLFNAVHFALFWQRVDPLAYLMGRQSRTAYLTRFVPEYPVTEYANAHLRDDATVYLAFLGDRGFYWRTKYFFDTHSPGVTLRQAVRDATDGAGVAAALHNRGIGYIASADALLNGSMRNRLVPADYSRWEAFVRDYLKPLYSSDGVGLYEIL